MSRVRLPRFYVYLLLSEHGEVYCGYTNCIRRRLREHNSPKNTGWTRERRWRLLAVRCFLDRHSATIVERNIKRSRYDKRNWIQRERYRLRELCRRHGIDHSLIAG
jgi:predicted GIY-YIG superfamily endonuclease